MPSRSKRRRIRRRSSALNRCAARTWQDLARLSPFREGELLRKLERYPLPGWAAEIGCVSWTQIILKFIVSHPAVTCANDEGQKRQWNHPPPGHTPQRPDCVADDFEIKDGNRLRNSGSAANEQ